MRAANISRRRTWVASVFLLVLIGLIAGSASAAAPSNDNLANATALDPDPSGGTLTLTQSTVGATKEVSEGDHAGDAGGASVWFTWNPNFQGTAYVSTTGSDFDTLLDISGAGVSSANDDITDATKTSETCFAVNLGMPVKIAVDGYLGASGTLNLHYGAWDGTFPCPERPPTLSANASAPKVGDTISGTGGAWVGSNTATFQWYRCHEYGCQKITGASGAEVASTQNYTIQPRDIGEALLYEESGTGPGGTSSNSSVRSGVVGQTPSLGTNGRIYWSSNRNGPGNWDIYSMLPDGSGLRHVTADPGDERMQAVTADGAGLAYIQNSQLTVSDADGENPVPLGLFGGYPIWSPDESRIAWSENDGIHLTNGVYDDFVLPINNVGTSRVMSWSPDGTKILFTEKATGFPYRIGIIQADGRGAVTWLTSYPLSSYGPAWSPTGTKIAFIRGDPAVDNERDLYVMNADGTNQTLLRAGFSSGTSSSLISSVAWSPDGQSLVYGQDALTLGNEQLFKMPAAGGPAVQLTNTVIGQNDLPFWAAQANYGLHVTIDGNGTVGGAPSISCTTTDCDGTYVDDTTVTLNATPAAGQVFSGWSDACSGTGPCVVSMTDSRQVAATFTSPSSGGGGSGGGGGGGGGGGSVPDLSPHIDASKTTAKVGDIIDFTTSITNSGGAGALQSHAFISIPNGATLLGPPSFESGSGCSAVTAAEDCNIDYVPNGGTTHLRYEMRVTLAGDIGFGVSVSSDRDSNPNNNATSLTIHVTSDTGTTTTTTTPAPRRTPTSPTVGVHKTGNSASNTMHGTAKNDSLNGAGGNDLLEGFAGDDTLLGGLGNDRIFGGAGNDHLVGGPGKDVLHGDAGNDTIDARDGQQDKIDCGTGHDTVVADKHDIISRTCEKVSRT
jgi:uncharacterized repeat protein (TIGR01451 family)